MIISTTTKDLLVHSHSSASRALVSVPSRGYMPYDQKKYDDYFKPRYFDNVRRQP